MTLSPPQPAPPVPPLPPAKLRQEYVSGGGSSVLAGMDARRLPWSFDDLTQDFGDDLYERMLYDPCLAASLNILKAAILEEGATLSPAVDDKDADGYDQAKAFVVAQELMLDDLDVALDVALWDLLHALAVGNRVAEQVYVDDQTYTGRRQLTLRALKVKPRRATAFVVDPYLNILGLLGQVPGQTGVQTGNVIATGNVPNLLPRTKFAVLSFRPRDNDPRGSSILRPAYNAWWLKMQTWQEYLRYLAQFATPSVVGKTPESATPATLVDETGAPIIGSNGLPIQVTPEESMLEQLVQIKNGAALALPHGSEVDPLWMQGDGKVFLEAFGLYDRQMTTAVLHQTRATMEAEHGSRADSETGQGILDTMIRQAKRAVCRMLRRDALRQHIVLNYGPKFAPLTPKVSLGEVERQDLTPLITALGRVGYQVDSSQFPAIDTLVNLPPRMVTAENQEPATKNQEPDNEEESDADARA